MKNDKRVLACGIAKELAKKAGNGAKPNAFMKEAWAIVRGETTMEPVKEFFCVEYKTLKGRSKSIVQTSTKEEAEKLFNNPDDQFGPRHEIIGVTKPKKISAGQLVTVDNNGTPMSGLAQVDIPTNGSMKEITLTIGRKDLTFQLSQVISAHKAPKEAVMKKGTKI